MALLQKTKLYVFSKDEYSPSVDPESLQILTYLKLVSKSPPIEIIHTCRSWKSPSGVLPTLVVNGKSYIGSDAIIKSLKQQGFVISEESDIQQVDTDAFSALVKDRLRLAILYVLWMDGRNYTEITSKLYGRISSFPLSQYLLTRQHKYVEKEITSTLPEEANLHHRGLIILNEAQDCITSLSHRLKNNRFFNGDSPSTLDAMVFGYLYIISQYPLPGNNDLLLHLNSLKNLSKFTERVQGLTFPEIKTRHPLIYVSPPVPYWKDPTVWTCVALGGALFTVHGIRIGFFSRLLSKITAN